MKNRTVLVSSSTAKIGCGAGCIGWLILIAIQLVIAATCWPYVINTIIDIAGSKHDHVGVWPTALIGLVPVIGGLGLPLLVVAWIVRMAMGI